MRCIEGGTYENGALRKAERVIPTYWLDETEVTVGDYLQCVNAGPCELPADWVFPACIWEEVVFRKVPGLERRPMDCRSWDEAVEYCDWVGKRLPDEWEWEWAARGRDEGRPYPWGSWEPTCVEAVVGALRGELGGAGCGTGQTWPVGSKPAGTSRDGVHDLVGNLHEWTASWHDATHKFRVARGGDYYFGGLITLRVDNRFAVDPQIQAETMGFRCAQTP